MKTKQSKILIIDDSAVNTMLLTGLLEDEHKIVTAEYGEKGIELASSEEPDLILLDVTMPGMDGYTVCDELKTNIQTRNIPVIFVTAMDDMEDEARGLEMGAIDYITKPFSPQIVKARVRNHLELKLYRDRLMQLSMIDGLTSIPNRRQFDRTISQEWQRGIRRETSVSLLLMDIDFFKQYNDQYGHLGGDDCLKQIAQLLTNQLQRPTDMVARYGGEEFVCVLPETDLEGARHVARHIIEAMPKANIEHSGSTVASYVTFSIGLVSMVPTAGFPLPDFIESADKALYKAKLAGRNRFIEA
ncbi:MAG: diguanylate cyclase (GGDEF)-like protein [Phenylobacterium sp.]|jgi:diguanylate cyclase (GGDEF)-like protein